MNWYTPRPPSQMTPVPYLHPAVVEYLESVIKPGFKVIEFGGGGSTIWLAARVREVITYEKDADWYNELAKHNLPNVTLRQAVYVPGAGDADMLILDGEPVEYRANWLARACQIVKPGGWVVLDNCNRPEYERQREQMQQESAWYATFVSNTPGHKFLNTEIYKLR